MVIDILHLANFMLKFGIKSVKASLWFGSQELITNGLHLTSQGLNVGFTRNLVFYHLTEITAKVL